LILGKMLKKYIKVKNNINNNIIQNKKSNYEKNIKTTIIIKNILLKINIIKSVNKCNSSILSNFSFYKNKIKIKKIKNVYKHNSKL